MHRFRLFSLLASIVAFAVVFSYPAHAAASGGPIMRMTTNLGVIEIELNRAKAPTTVDNFLKYADDGLYNGTIFHRVIPGFMIQGGGFKPGFEKQPTREPIKNEAANGLKNVVGSIAMARTSDPHSATSQFFINTASNDFLDKENARDGWGYAVFGKVIKGMDVVQKIESTPTGRNGSYRDAPKQDVIIEKVERINKKGGS
jgi:cyclophilin family peptidyl-prolyl cis-trans isomerase